MEDFGALLPSESEPLSQWGDDSSSDHLPKHGDATDDDASLLTCTDTTGEWYRGEKRQQEGNGSLTAWLLAACTYRPRVAPSLLQRMRACS